MFAAFIKLHKKGVQDKRGYWLNIGPILRWLMGVVPLVLLFISLFFTLIPALEVEAILDNMTLIVSTVACVVAGEIMVARMSQKDNKKKLKRKKTLKASRR